MAQSLFQVAGGISQRAYDAGYAEGKQDATCIALPESSYGATQPAIVAVAFTGLRDLINQIRSRQWHQSGDNPGRAYMGTCRLLHIHHGDYEKVAILKVATHYDI